MNPNEQPPQTPAPEAGTTPPPAATPGIAQPPADPAATSAPASQPVTPPQASASQVSAKSKMPFLIGVGLVVITLIAAIMLLAL